MADYHALIKTQNPHLVHQSTLEVAATWLALGLDTEKVTFYRQSDIPEIQELTWFLSCMTAKGLMNRAHAYKHAVQGNIDIGEDEDFAISMGLFGYPILMAADILMFNAHEVPVGRDQVQHVEMARDIAQRFNYRFGKHFVLPKAEVDRDASLLRGLDGRKMSKSYNNSIPLFLSEKQLKKSINRIKTNLLEPGESKDPDSSTVFHIWRAFASRQQIEEMREKFEQGIGWGEAKKQLFHLINTKLESPRERYYELLKNPERVEFILNKGAQKARAESKIMIEDLRDAVGIRPLS